MTKELLEKEGFIEIPGVSKYMIHPQTKEMRGVASGEPLSLKNGKTFQFLDDAKKYMNMPPEKVLALCNKPVKTASAKKPVKAKPVTKKSPAPKKVKGDTVAKVPSGENMAAKIKELHGKGKSVAEIKEITGMTTGHYVKDVVWRILNPKGKKK